MTPLSPSLAPLPEVAGPSRSRRGLLVSTLLLSVVQAAAFWWFARAPIHPLVGVGSIPGRPGSPLNGRTILALEGVHDASQWVPNPRRFLSPDSSVLPTQGTRNARREQAKPNWATPPRYLPLEAIPPSATVPIPTPAGEPIHRDAPHPPSPATRPLALQQSGVWVQGPLQSRGFVRAPELRPWTGPEAIGTTRVDISVNADGEILLARVTDSCGVKAADEMALTTLRAARFAVEPKKKTNLNDQFNANALVRGTVVVRWNSTISAAVP